MDIFPFISFLLFLIIIFGRIIYLKKKEIQIGTKSRKSLRIKFILYTAFLVIIHFWIFEISKPIFHISFLPDLLSNNLIESFIIQIAGIILVLISLGLLIATLLSFNDSFRFGDEFKQPWKTYHNRNFFQFHGILFFYQLKFIFWELL